MGMYSVMLYSGNQRVWSIDAMPLRSLAKEEFQEKYERLREKDGVLVQNLGTCVSIVVVVKEYCKGVHDIYEDLAKNFHNSDKWKVLTEGIDPVINRYMREVSNGNGSGCS